MSGLDASHYKVLFELDQNGIKILEDLTSRFGRSIYVRGGQEAERESCYRAGQRSVLDFILAQVNRANGVKGEEENDD